MPLTVAAIEEDLDILIAPFLALVTTTDAERAGVLRMAVRFAASRLPGFETADPIDVADEDVAVLTRAQLGTFVSLAEYKALWVIYDRYTKVDQSAGEESQSLSQRADRLWKKIEHLKAELGTLATEPDAGTTPGPAAHGLIRAGRCYPHGSYYDVPAACLPRPGYWYGGVWRAY